MRNLEERKEKMEELRNVQKNIDEVIKFLNKRNLKTDSIYGIKRLIDSSIIAVSCIELGLKVFGEDSVEQILKGDKV